MERAIRSGREVIVHMPMEATDPSVNPGRNAIFARMSNREVYDRVQEYFVELNMSVGANQHMGSRITQSRPLMRASLRYLAENNLFFVDSRTTGGSVAREIATELGIGFAQRDLFLDAPECSDVVLHQRLQDLNRLMNTQGRALVITHCSDRGRLNRLKRFIDEAVDMGWELVPVSVYVERTRPV
jgi:polysaccharide deacetylase 2 family uncharacterized protein YibQ